MYYNRFKVLDIYKDIICESSNSNIRKLRAYFERGGLSHFGKRFNQLDDDERDRLIKFVDENSNRYSDLISDITTNQEYENWVINLFVSGELLSEDFEKVKEVLGLFDKVKRMNSFPNDKKNIMVYNSYSELYKTVKMFNRSVIGSSEIDYGNNEILFNDGDIDVIKITNFKDGKGLFQDSGWCVKHENHFNDYGVPYYLIVDNGVTNGEKRIALINYNSSRIRDINDHVITGVNSRYEHLYRLALKICDIEKIGNDCLYKNDLGILMFYNIDNGVNISELFKKFYISCPSRETTKLAVGILCNLYNLLGDRDVYDLSASLSSCFYDGIDYGEEFNDSLRLNLSNAINVSSFKLSVDIGIEYYDLFCNPDIDDRDQIFQLTSIFSKLRDMGKYVNISEGVLNKVIAHIIYDGSFNDIKRRIYSDYDVYNYSDGIFGFIRNSFGEDYRCIIDSVKLNELIISNRDILSAVFKLFNGHFSKFQ